MKPSYYNTFLPYKGEYILYNTLYDSVAFVDSEMKEALESGKCETLPEEVFSLMKTKKFLVDDDSDEITVLRTERKFYHCVSSSDCLNLELIMTYACNLACPYCFEILAKDHHESMNSTAADILLTFIDRETQKENYKRKVNILFFGGEPMVNWSGCRYMLEQLSTYYSHITYAAQIITNGTILTDSMIEDMQNYNITKVDIPFDGAREDHNKRRIMHDGSGTYDIIMENAIRLIDAGINLVIKVNVDRNNYTHIQELFEDLTSRGLGKVPLGISQILYPKLTPTTGPDYCMRMEDLPVIMPQIWSLAEKWGFGSSRKPRKVSATCMNSDFSSYVIDPLLDVYKCSEFIGLKEHTAGRITQDGIFEPNDFYYSMMARDPTYLEKCSSCVLLPVCSSSSCAALSYGVSKDYFEPQCYIEKALFEEMLRWHAENLEKGHKGRNQEHESAGSNAVYGGDSQC